MKYLRDIVEAKRSNKELERDIDLYSTKADRDREQQNKSGKLLSPKTKAKYAANRRRKEMSRKHPELSEETELNETENVTLTVPLFIRMLEFAKEDAKTDMDLHKATEKLQAIGGVVDMDSYKKIVEDVELDEADKWKKKKGPSQKVDIKTKGDLAKERRERNAAMRGAKRDVKETGEKVKFQKFKDWRSVRKTAREKIEEGKSEYSKTRPSRGESDREHFYVDAGRRARYARELKGMGMDARHEYSPYENLAGLSVPKEHKKKVSEYLWPRSRKKR